MGYKYEAETSATMGYIKFWAATLSYGNFLSVSSARRGVDILCL